MESDVPQDDGGLSGGALNAALANELGKLVADFTGRGATRSRAFVQHDVVVCVWRTVRPERSETSSPPARRTSSGGSATRYNAPWRRS